MSTVTVTIDLSSTDAHNTEGWPVQRQLKAGASAMRTGTVGSVSVLGQLVDARTPSGDLAALDADGVASFVLERNSDMAESDTFWVVQVGPPGKGASWWVRVGADVPSTVAIGDLEQLTTGAPPATYPDPANFEQVAHKGHAGGYAALDDSGQVLDGNGDPVTGGGGGAPSGAAGGDLGGTYPNPTVPGLASKASTTALTNEVNRATAAEGALSGRVTVLEAGGTVYIKDPANPLDEYWVWDVRYRDAGNAVPEEPGDRLDLTAIPTHSATVAALVILPDPAVAGLFVLDYHKGGDPVGAFDFIKPTFDGNWPTLWYGTAFDGSHDAQIAVRSSGDGTYHATIADPTMAVTFAAPEYYAGAGLDANMHTLHTAMGNHEGILDRWMFVSAVSESPTFDIASPTWDYGTPVVGSKVVALGLTDGSTPSVPWSWRVGDGGGGSFTFTPSVDPDVFNPPGNGYRVTFSKSGDADDGRTYIWLSNDPVQYQRGGNPLAVDDPTGRWLHIFTGTPI